MPGIEISRVAEILVSRFDPNHTHRPKTVLLNEGWMLRLLFDALRSSGARGSPLSFYAGASRISEGDLDPPFEQWGMVPAHMRATVAAELYRGGYHIVEKGRRLVIERRQPS